MIDFQYTKLQPLAFKPFQNKCSRHRGEPSVFILWLFLLSTVRSTTQASRPRGSWNIERTCCSTIFWPSRSSSVRTAASTHAASPAGRIPNSRKSPSLSSVSVSLWNVLTCRFINRRNSAQITHLHFHISWQILPVFHLLLFYSLNHYWELDVCHNNDQTSPFTPLILHKHVVTFPPFQTVHLSAWSPDTNLWWRCRRDRNLTESLPNYERSPPLKSSGKRSPWIFKSRLIEIDS